MMCCGGGWGGGGEGRGVFARACSIPPGKFGLGNTSAKRHVWVDALQRHTRRDSECIIRLLAELNWHKGSWFQFPVRCRRYSVMEKRVFCFLFSFFFFLTCVKLAGSFACHIIIIQYLRCWCNIGGKTPNLSRYLPRVAANVAARDSNTADGKRRGYLRAQARLIESVQYTATLLMVSGLPPTAAYLFPRPHLKFDFTFRSVTNNSPMLSLPKLDPRTFCLLTC